MPTGLRSAAAFGARYGPLLQQKPRNLQNGTELHISQQGGSRPEQSRPQSLNSCQQRILQPPGRIGVGSGSCQEFLAAFGEERDDQQGHARIRIDLISHVVAVLHGLACPERMLSPCCYPMWQSDIGNSNMISVHFDSEPLLSQPACHGT